MTRKWRNWAGNQNSRPIALARPKTEQDVVDAVRQATQSGMRVKAIGSGHSFTDISKPDEMMLDMSSLNAVIEVDPVNGVVRVQSGIVLSELNAYLERHGLSMPNLGDVTYQTLAGAMSTSTHGTGLMRTGLAAQILGFKMVVATGEIITCSTEENQEVFHCGRVSLGALGIITEYSIRVVPLFNLHAVERPMLISDVVSQFEQLIKNNDFFEFYWIPHTKWALTKANNVTNLPADPPARFSTWMHKIVLENIAFGILCRIGRVAPSLIPRFATLLPGAGRVEFVNVSHRVFSSKRLVKFYEMEYSISISAVGRALNEIMQMIEQRNLKISFPIEVRCTGADDIPLSTSSGRESAYIAVHMYQGCDYDEYFKAVEEILVRYEGRPHWGKLHYMDGTQLSSLYPEYQRFIEVRNQLDPEGVFTNDYLRRVLGR